MLFGNESYEGVDCILMRKRKRAGRQRYKASSRVKSSEVKPYTAPNTMNSPEIIQKRANHRSLITR